MFLKIALLFHQFHLSGITSRAIKSYHRKGYWYFIAIGIFFCNVMFYHIMSYFFLKSDRVFKYCCHKLANLYATGSIAWKQGRRPSRFILISWCARSDVKRNCAIFHFMAGSYDSNEWITLIVKRLSVGFKDGAYYCYCVYVLHISRYSDFLWVAGAHSYRNIFARPGLKLYGESRT